MRKKLRFGIIGGGQMGREMASALSRWCALEDVGVDCELIAVCDLKSSALDWFRIKVPSIRLLTQNYPELLASDLVDVIYVAVPHHLHEQIYLDTLEAGKDLLGEKPFGIDLKAARKITLRAKELRRFVRCSSHHSFLPGAQRVFQLALAEKLGRLLEVRTGFLHSSDLDPTKPANWKRQKATCGDIGVMGDLGLHALHLPLRLGWKPLRVYAQLQRGYPERPDGKGGRIKCDTWDNAALSTAIKVQSEEVPMRLELKRLAPGETNSWYFEVLGTEQGARFSTKDSKALWLFERGYEQSWRRVDLGCQTIFKSITMENSEVGFADSFQQMVASFAAELAGVLGERFGCLTPDEAVACHEIFASALCSQDSQSVVELYNHRLPNRPENFPYESQTCLR